MKRTFFMILTGILVLIALAGVFFFIHMDSYAKTAIEKFGSAIMGTRLTVGKVEISPTSGEGNVTNLVISNPAGFQTPHAFYMENTHVVVDVKSIPTDVMIIDEVVLDSPEIIYEVNATGNNYAVLRSNVNNYLSKPENAMEDGIIASKQIIVKDFYLRNGKVKVIAPMLQNQSFMVSLPTIHLSELGRDQGKGNLPKIMQQVMTVVTNSVVSAVGNVTLENFMKYLPNTVTGIAHGVLNDTGTAVQNVGEGIGEILGGKK
jgi:hypothetical protein